MEILWGKLGHCWTRLAGGGKGPPPTIKRKKRAITPRDTVVAQCLQGKRSTVLALSRTLCAGSADAAALAAASLTATARGALPGGRSGRRDGGFRSNKGMGGGCSRTGGIANLVAGVEQRLLFEQGAGHRQQAVGDGAQGPAVAVAALAQRGITATAERVVLGCQAAGCARLGAPCRYQNSRF